MKPTDHLAIAVISFKMVPSDLAIERMHPGEDFKTGTNIFWKYVIL